MHVSSCPVGERLGENKLHDLRGHILEQHIAIKIDEDIYNSCSTAGRSLSEHRLS
jgi:hypothetical protein